tara:strand:- start:279 stop:1130 length:852 start_codon:yes stop_codon:yes gene_type:complete
MSLNNPTSNLKDINLFCFGLGYTAGHLTTLLPSVKGTSKTGHHDTFAFTDAVAVQKALQQATHVLISIPPVDSKDIVLTSFLKNLNKLPNLKWVGYLSATSVYGDHQGGWVDETSRCHPSTSRGVERLNIESEWLASALPLHIFRLSGIYGKGRSVFNRLQSKSIKRIDKPGHLFSRIHVEDIGQLLKASMFMPTPGEIFNVADDLPAESRDLIEYACRLLKIPAPPLIPFEKADLSVMAKEFYQDNKKVANKKIKDYFDIDLTYPTYKEGLLSIFKSRDPFQ